MAEGGGVPQLGGYDYEFVSEVPEKWMCLICQLPLKDPMQIMGCGHRLCQICIDEVMRRPHAACPADRTPITPAQVFPDAGCKREIQDLHVKCPIEDCSWTGELRAVKAHETNCPDGKVACENLGCEEMIKRKDLTTHMDSACDYRIIECKYCRGNNSWMDRFIHEDFICKRYPLLCENECGAKNIPREEMKNHLTAQCPLTVISCDYKSLGCDTKSPRIQMDEHMNSAMKRHLELACKKLEQQEKTIREQGKRLEIVQAEHIAEQAGMSLKLVQAERDIKVLMDRFSLERTNEVFERRLRDISPDITSRLSDGDTVFTEPFYLEGYRMTLFFNLNAVFGSRLNDRSEVNVGLHLNAGKFDNELEWPLTRNLQIELSHIFVHMGDKYALPSAKKPIPRPRQKEVIPISSTSLKQLFGEIKVSLRHHTITVSFKK